MDLTAINLSDVQLTSFEPIPAGKYTAIITDAIETPTKAGTGSYLKLTVQIIEGPYSGRLVWENLNLNNPNPKSVQIAQQTLKEICTAINTPNPVTEMDLLNKPLGVELKINRDPNYGDSNSVKRFFSVAEAPTTPAYAPQKPAAPPVNTAAPAGAPVKKPWEM